MTGLPQAELLSLLAFAVVATATPGGANLLAASAGARFGLARSLPLLLGLSLGLAARGIDWDALGWRGAANTFAALLSRALESLFVTADAVADAVAARGYTGAATHRLSAPGSASSRRRNPLRILPDTGALILLGLFVSHFVDEGSVLAKLF